MDEGSATGLVARVAVVGTPREVFRPVVAAFQAEARGWHVLANPRVSWEEDAAWLVVEVDVTAEDLTIWEPDRFANFIADQVFKIAAVMAPEGFASFRIEVLASRPVGRDDLLRPPLATEHALGLAHAAADPGV